MATDEACGENPRYIFVEYDLVPLLPAVPHLESRTIENIHHVLTAHCGLSIPQRVEESFEAILAIYMTPYIASYFIFVKVLSSFSFEPHKRNRVHRLLSGSAFSATEPIHHPLCPSFEFVQQGEPLRISGRFRA